MIRFYIVFLGAVFVSSISQILLKQSAKIQYNNIVREYLNLRVVAAYFLFFAATLVTLYAYKNVPLSMGPILEASGYIWVALLGWIFLKERISKKKLAGLFVIIVGIIISAM